MSISAPVQGRARAFTLIEMLLAVAVCAVVLAAMHGVFYGAMRLQKKTTTGVEQAIPLQQTLAIMKRDLANLVAPGGPLSGALQTTPTNATPLPGGATGPQFYTATGRLTDSLPWAEVQKVTYYLAQPTNRLGGMDLYRGVTRNLLPVMQEEPEPQFLLGGVQRLTFWFYDGTQWVATWDSTLEATPLPRAIKVEIELLPEPDQKYEPTPVALVVPLLVQARTNATATTGGSTGGAL